MSSEPMPRNQRSLLLKGVLRQKFLCIEKILVVAESEKFETSGHTWSHDYCLGLEWPSGDNVLNLSAIKYSKIYSYFCGLSFTTYQSTCWGIFQYHLSINTAFCLVVCLVIRSQHTSNLSTWVSTSLGLIDRISHGICWPYRYLWCIGLCWSTKSVHFRVFFLPYILGNFLAC